MAELIIHDERIAWRLLDIARRENRSVEDVLDILLRKYAAEESEGEPTPGSFAMMAQSALKADLRSTPTDTSERSREILAGEYADYLKRRMNEQSNSD